MDYQEIFDDICKQVMKDNTSLPFNTFFEPKGGDSQPFYTFNIELYGIEFFITSCSLTWMKICVDDDELDRIIRSTDRMFKKTMEEDDFKEIELQYKMNILIGDQ
jgi:hypothetical protein